jgi:methionine-rich copper-binding protein CopC
MSNRRVILTLSTLPLLLGAWTLFHIELRASSPAADQVLEGAPQEIWLEFSTTPDTARSTFSVRGPDGAVQLDTIRWNAEDEPAILRAKVMGEMPPGDYLISWVAAPVDDHGGRGRISFSIAGGS